MYVCMCVCMYRYTFYSIQIYSNSKCRLLCFLIHSWNLGGSVRSQRLWWFSNLLMNSLSKTCQSSEATSPFLVLQPSILKYFDDSNIFKPRVWFPTQTVFQCSFWKPPISSLVKPTISCIPAALGIFWGSRCSPGQVSDLAGAQTIDLAGIVGSGPRDACLNSCKIHVDLNGDVRWMWYDVK